MSRCLLITRPEYDPPTRYLCKWSEKVKDEAEKKGVRVIDLHRKKASRKRFIGTLKKVKPGLVFLNGHGDATSIRGHNDEIILRDNDGSDVNVNIIFARSCESARILGRSITAQNVKAFLGYKRPFWLGYNPEKISKPLEDERAALFLEPSNYLVISLLKGHPAGCANRRAKKKFLENIIRLLAIGPSSGDYDFIRALHWNMINQVCLGDENTLF